MESNVYAIVLLCIIVTIVTLIYFAYQHQVCLKTLSDKNDNLEHSLTEFRESFDDIEEDSQVLGYTDNPENELGQCYLLNNEPQQDFDEPQQDFDEQPRFFRVDEQPRFFRVDEPQQDFDELQQDFSEPHQDFSDIKMLDISEISEMSETCTRVLKSGKNSGKMCGKPCLSDSLLCKFHS